MWITHLGKMRTFTLYHQQPDVKMATVYVGKVGTRSNTFLGLGALYLLTANLANEVSFALTRGLVS